MNSKHQEGTPSTGVKLSSVSNDTNCDNNDNMSTIAKIKALPGVKKDQIKDMIKLALTVSQQPQQRRRRPRIRKRDPSRVPRPMNCFLAYRLEKQKQIASVCPGTNHREISKVVAKWWSQESNEEKEKYRLIAEKDKQLHKEKYPNYKYSPKKKRQTGSDNNESTANDDSSSKDTASPIPSIENIGQPNNVLDSSFIFNKQDQAPSFLPNCLFTSDESLYPASCSYEFRNKSDDPVILPPITNPATLTLNGTYHNAATDYNNFNLMQNIGTSLPYNSYSASPPVFDYPYSINMAGSTVSHCTTGKSALPTPVLPPIQQQQQQQHGLPWITDSAPPAFSFSTPSTANLSPTYVSSPSSFDDKQQGNLSTVLTNYLNIPTFEPLKNMFQNHQQLLPSYYPTLPTLEEFQNSTTNLTDMLNIDFPLLNPISSSQQTTTPDQTLLNTFSNH